MSSPVRRVAAEQTGLLAGLLHTESNPDCPNRPDCLIIQPALPFASMTSPIPCLQFDSDVFPLPERFEQWQRAVAAYDVSVPAGADPARFRATATAWLLGDIVVTNGSLTPIRFVRTPEKATADGEDRYSLLLLTSGSWNGEVDGVTLTVGPGEVVAFDLTRPIDTAGTDNDHITLGISRAAIAATGVAVPDLHGRVLDGPAGRLVADHLLELVRTLPLATMADAPTIAKETAILYAHCFAALPPESKLARLDRGVTIRHRVKRYIDEHLASPSLAPDLICSDVAVSRATLYRAFEPIGGVAAYIQTRRLEAAHTHLAQPDRQGKVASVGYALGFSSDAHFNKAFRRRFGFTPGTTRQNMMRKAEGVSKDDTSALYREWVQGLTSR